MKSFRIIIEPYENTYFCGAAAYSNIIDRNGMPRWHIKIDLVQSDLSRTTTIATLFKCLNNFITEDYNAPF